MRSPRKRIAARLTFLGFPVTPETPSEAELEAELLKLSRSRLSAAQLQPRVAAVRTLLARRTRERIAAEREERNRIRKQRAERDSSDDESEKAARLVWLDVDIGPEMFAALGYGLRDRQPISQTVAARVERDADRILSSPDPLGELERWKAANPRQNRAPRAAG
jgi:hypothetical protein